MISGIANVFSSRLFQIAIGALTSVFLARILDPIGYGAYVLALTFVTTLLIPMQHGMRSLVIREFASPNLRPDFSWWALKGTLIWAAAASLVLGLGMWGLHNPLTRNLLPLIFPATLTLVVLCLMFFFSSVLAGQKRTVLEQIVQNVLRPASFMGVLACLYFLSAENSFKPNSALFAYLASAVVALAFLSKYSLPKFKLKRAEVTKDTRRQWRNSLVLFSGIAGIDVILQSFDVLMIGAMSNTEEVGIYRVGAVLGGLMALPLAAISTYAAPHIAAADTSDAVIRMQQWCLRLALYSLLATICLLALSGTLGKMTIAWTFGEQFLEAYAVWMILGVASFFNSFFGLNRLVLMMTDNEGAVFKILAYAAALNIVLNIVLVKEFGVIGAAIATTLSVIFWNVWLHVELQRVNGFGVAVFSAPMSSVREGPNCHD